MSQIQNQGQNPNSGKAPVKDASIKGQEPSGKPEAGADPQQNRGMPRQADGQPVRSTGDAKDDLKAKAAK